MRSSEERSGKEGRGRGRKITLFDLFLIVAAVVVGYATFVIVSGRRGSTGGGEAVTVIYRVELENVSEAVRDSARVGVQVRDGVRKTPLGEVTGVTSHNTTFIKTDIVTGEVVRSPMEGRYNVILTCEAAGSLVGGRVLIGDYVMAVGTAVSLQSSAISGTGYCISVSYH